MQINFKVDELSSTMLRLGPHVYRSADERQMIIYGDIENPITVRGSDMANSDAKENFFYCDMAFHYYHPNEQEASLLIGRDPREDTGEWHLLYLEPSELVNALPKGMDRTRCRLHFAVRDAVYSVRMCTFRHTDCRHC